MGHMGSYAHNAFTFFAANKTVANPGGRTPSKVQKVYPALWARVLSAIRMMTVSDDERIQELYHKLREGTMTEGDPQCSSLFPATERDRRSGREIYSSDNRDRSRSVGNNNCDVLPQRKHILSMRPYRQTTAAMREILGEVESLDGLKDVCHIAYGKPNVEVVRTRPEHGVNGVSWCTATVKTMAVTETIRLIADNLHYDQIRSNTSGSLQNGQYSDASVHNDTTWQTQWAPAELSTMKMNKPDGYMWRPHNMQGPFQDDDSHPWTAIHRTIIKTIRHRHSLKCTVTTNSTPR